MKWFLLFLFIIPVICQSSDLPKHCQAKLRVHRELSNDQENILALDLAIQVLDEKMLFFIEGKILLDKSEYTVSRSITYSYKQVDSGYYELNKISSEVLSLDNYYNDNITEFFGIEANKPKYRIEKFHGQYMFSNHFSPVFLCFVS